MRAVRHENIIQLLAFSESNDHYYLILEGMSHFFYLFKNHFF